MRAEKGAAATAAWIAAAVLVTASASFVANRFAGGDAAALLPLLGALVMFAGWLARDTPRASAVAAIAPLLLVVAVAVPAGANRSAALGVLVAAAIAMAVSALHESGGLTLRGGAALLVAALALMRLPGVPEGRTLAATLIIAGCVVLFASLAAGRRVTPLDLILPFVAGVAVPLSPERLVAIPILFAALVWTIRSSRVRLPAAALLLLCLFAGRWSWPLAAAGIAVALAGTRRIGDRHAFIAVPLAKTASAYVLKALPFLIASASAIRTAPYAAAGALALLLLAAGLRPSLSVFYGLAAAVMLASRDEVRSSRYAAPAAVVAGLMLAMFPWSGALAGAFPLPATVVSLSFVVAATAGTMLRHRFWAAVLIPLSVLVAVVVWLPSRSGTWESVMAVLRPGESVNIEPAARGNVAEVIASGGNLLDVPAGEIIADLHVIAEGGAVYRRTVSVGEIGDWGALRQEHWFIARHGLPNRPAGPLEGSGASSYLSGAGIIGVTIPERISIVRVTMRPSAPADASLHVDAARFHADRAHRDRKAATLDQRGAS